MAHYKEHPMDRSKTRQEQARQGKLTMHVDNISSFQNGDPPRPGEGALR
eukprot:CAMPEP_0194308888 /NCGR_PEP_ID=MMETSP0171-20130528/5851_1 /TAXON_ID=218684 /ORGANISM="Corethron pennatum, Strain L29A3" /LENGTH=48 /DNA_ID= /DNA_START= /DNA_END= /DNA_ORIENTATION=